ncbi:hypothetical protein [Streptomyces sp. ODS28]|uniref:hypothetical protein n=1 Tax=Streptomyces sp. ODS28 TaxID=3136688 RepID=UPI0031ECED43
MIVGNSIMDVSRQEMLRVTSEDFAELRKISRGYCRAVDATRSRKRMNGSGTVAHSGQAPYGTDDVSDDVAQDSVFLFARRLGKIIATSEVAAVWLATQEPMAWQYVRRDGEVIVVSRATVRYWAVRDAAARNGYRLSGRPDASDMIAGGEDHPELLDPLATVPYLASHSEEIFRMAWGDGEDFPVLRTVLEIGACATDLGRAGVLGQVAQRLFGGPRNSSSKVQRADDAAVKEWRPLKGRLDGARDDLVYRSARRA